MVRESIFPSIPRLEVGMDYVPFDDFPALLHKGERVLTADEAKGYRKDEQVTLQHLSKQHAGI